MAGQSAASIEEFRDEMLHQMARRSPQLGRGAQFESVEERPRALPPIALGLAKDQLAGNALAIRVQGGAPSSMREAAKVREEAEKRDIPVDFAAIEES